MRYKPILWLIGLSCLLLTCKGNKNVPPLEQLPPETQIGANTFGCLVNGVAWTPKGNAGFTPNFSPVLEANNQGGWSFSIYTYRKGNGIDQAINMGINNISSIGVYSFFEDDIGLIFYDSSNCKDFRLDNSKSIGTIEITKYDMENFIISGKFNAKLFKNSCDTLRITQWAF
ncbi:MAG: hypothetical protein MUE85_18935 [Microscillaceae bacterium]|jgi:hypothetical protein|nr:hypothetical protein [Microscillaceae bacterium]